MSKVYILYHSNCYDGLGAAYAAWKRFGDSDAGMPVEYIPVGYGKEPPQMEDKSFVYILDMSYSPDTIKKMARRHEWITILDHHKSAMLDWAGLDYKKDTYTCELLQDEQGDIFNITVMFDMKVSGAGFAWDYFMWNPNNGNNERPKFIDMIEDRDLWKFKIEGSKEFHSYLLSVPQDFRRYEELESETSLKNAIAQGSSLQRMTNQIVENICKNAQMKYAFLGGKAVVVNTSSHWSEVGNRLLELFPEADFACSYTDLPGDIRMFSLRSKAPFDVSIIAQTYGGGGHPQAAGFKAKIKVPLENIEYELIKHK